jgi:hypothetical protein
MTYEADDEVLTGAEMLAFARTVLLSLGYRYGVSGNLHDNDLHRRLLSGPNQCLSQIIVLLRRKRIRRTRPVVAQEDYAIRDLFDEDIS